MIVVVVMMVVVVVSRHPVRSSWILGFKAITAGARTRAANRFILARPRGMPTSGADLVQHSS